jgi:PAS domain-containing protein
MAEWSALTRLMRLLVHSDSGAALLDRLHEHLIEQAGGVSSIVVHVDRTTAHLRASSASRVEYLPLEPWPAGPGEHAAIDRALSLVEVVPVEFAADSRTGQLLGAPAALVVPLSGEQPAGAVMVGMREAAGADSAAEGVLAVADAFVLALERARLRRASDLHREIARLVAAFRADAGSWLELHAPLTRACRAAARLFASERAAVWLHDRSARELVLVASNQGGHGPQSERVPVADALSRAAAALRTNAPELGLSPGAHGDTPFLVAPLKGVRRTIGVFELERVHVEPGDERQILNAAAMLGQQLSLSLENLQLFDQTIRAERELGGVIDALGDLVIVCDAEWRVVRGTRAFAARMGLPASDLVGSDLRDLIGEALAGSLSQALASLPPAGERAVSVSGTMRGERVTIDATGLNPDDPAAGIILVVRDADPE